jgi:hypothetical protein
VITVTLFPSSCDKNGNVTVTDPGSTKTTTVTVANATITETKTVTVGNITITSTVTTEGICPTYHNVTSTYTSTINNGSVIIITSISEVPNLHDIVSVTSTIRLVNITTLYQDHTPPGEIVGLTIGLFAAGALIAAIPFLLRDRRKRLKDEGTETTGEQTGEGQTYGTQNEPGTGTTTGGYDSGGGSRYAGTATGEQSGS